MQNTNAAKLMRLLRGQKGRGPKGPEYILVFKNKKRHKRAHKDFSVPTPLDPPKAFLLWACVCLVNKSCGRGGIGRRAALRSLWEQSRGSSSLLDRTIF